MKRLIAWIRFRLYRRHFPEPDLVYGMSKTVPQVGGFVTLGSTISVPTSWNQPPKD